MKFTTLLMAAGLLSLSFASSAGAHDPDEMSMRFPALKKEVSKPVTCTELAAADSHTLNMSDPDIVALDKKCKAEAAVDAKAKAAAAKKAPAKKTK